MNKTKIFLSSVLAGICIGLGGAVFVSCDVKYIGAFLFSIGLLTICNFKLNLFTGKVGYVENNKESIFNILEIFLGNFVGTFLIGMSLNVTEKYQLIVQTMCENKLSTPLIYSFILAIFCGMIMFIAVNMFKENKSSLGILIGVPTFILAGFEHSIADMFYFCLSGMFSIDVLIFIIVVALGNTVGAILFKRLLLKTIIL